MRNYCTLSDRNYLAKLLALHESLLRHSSEPFTLNVLALDKDAFTLLKDFNLENVEVFPVDAFVSAMRLEQVRKSRTHQEWAWSCASNFMEFLMPWVGDLAYLDADMMAFGDLKVAFDEIGSRSIGITPHRFPPHRKEKEINGRFNVGYLYAKNNDVGRRCITRWAGQVREWCYNRVEGKNACGDQKFLDEWPELYGNEVCSIDNIGVNAAPWNIDQYVVTAENSGPLLNGVPLILFHFHEYQHSQKLTNYKLRIVDRKCIYEPYVDAWERATLRIYEQEKIVSASRLELEMQGDRA